MVAVVEHSVKVKRVKIPYGGLADQFGHLYFRESTGGIPIVLIHGGSWSTEYSLAIFTAIARDLAARGAVVWNIEYRRINHLANAERAVGGWPETATDVRRAIEFFPTAAREVFPPAQALELSKQQLTVIGHSAGGQLALWAVGEIEERRAANFDNAKTSGAQQISRVIAQAAPTDLYLDGKPRQQVLDFFGISGTPTLLELELVKKFSPVHRRPLCAQVNLVHAMADELIPVEISREYRDVMNRIIASGTGDNELCSVNPVVLKEISAEGHAAFCDPHSQSHRETLKLLPFPNELK